MQELDFAKLCAQKVVTYKGEQVKLLSVVGLSDITDYIILATGTSLPHIRAIYRDLIDELRQEQHMEPSYKEDFNDTPWMLLAYHNVMIHIMNDDIRGHYNLEGLWQDATVIDF